MIALDYNPTAQKVAEAGYAMAAAMKAEITLLHVITDPVYYASMEYSPILGYSGFMGLDQLQAEGAGGLQKASVHFLEKIKSHLGDETIQVLVKEGNFADTILKTAKAEHASMIVMGSHSRKWLENIVMGSVTAEVLQQTSIPLFIIPTRQHKKQ